MGKIFVCSRGCKTQGFQRAENISFAIQKSNLGYPATVGPVPIQIIDLARYGSSLLFLYKHSNFSRVDTCFNLFTHTCIRITGGQIAEVQLYIFKMNFTIIVLKFSDFSDARNRLCANHSGTSNVFAEQWFLGLSFRRRAKHAF